MRTFSLLLACAGFIYAQNPQIDDIAAAPVPADPHELVTGTAQFASSPQDRAIAMALLERARQNGDLHMPGGSSFALKVTINVASGLQTGVAPPALHFRVFLRSLTKNSVRLSARTTLSVP